RSGEYQAIELAGAEQVRIGNDANDLALGIDNRDVMNAQLCETGGDLVQDSGGTDGPGVVGDQSAQICARHPTAPNGLFSRSLRLHRPSSGSANALGKYRLREIAI